MINSTRVIVIGGGIIGLAIAEKLMSQGHRVTLIEKDHIAAGASQGNAAGLAFSEIIPLASPGIIKKALFWFLDPLGPFSVVARDLPVNARWLWGFIKATHRDQFQKSLLVQTDLMQLSKQTFPELLDRCQMQQHVRANGALYLYESAATYQKDIPLWALRRAQHIPFTCYEGDALHRFQQGLSSRFHAGIFTPDWHTLDNPYTFCQTLHARLTEKGLITRYQNVTDITEGQVTLHDGETLNTDKIIVAAGPWSSILSKKLGDPVPLIGERGYNTTLPKSAFTSLERTLIFAEQGFVVTPLVDGIRIGGASEIAKLSRPPHYQRGQAMLKKAMDLLPELIGLEGHEWMGARPTTADTLPVISYSSRSKHIIYAFGHGHLGLTQSTATAKLVAELIADAPTSIDMTPLRINRF